MPEVRVFMPEISIIFSAESFSAESFSAEFLLVSSSFCLSARAESRAIRIKNLIHWCSWVIK
ncbi:MAG: hypothetical protein ACRCVT_05015 [Leadbetterella sp.]